MSRTFVCIVAWCVSFGLSGVAFAQSPSPDDAQRRDRPLAEIHGVDLAAGRPSLALEDAPAVRAEFDRAADLASQGDVVGAIERLTAITTREKGDYFEVLRLLADLKARIGREAEARAMAQYAAALRPGDPDIHYLLGRLYLRSGDTDQAIANLRTATAAAEKDAGNPRVTAAWFELGECLQRGGYVRAALEAYERFDAAITDVSPEHRNAREVAAILTDNPLGAVDQRLALLRKLGRGKDAVPILRSATERDPQSAVLARRYVELLLETGDTKGALSFSKERLSRRSSTEATSSSSIDETVLALALRAAGKAQELDPWLAEIEKGIETSAPEAALARVVARQLDQVDDAKRAAALWRRLAESDPKSAEFAWALSASLRRSGALRPAIDSLIAFVRENSARASVPHGALREWLRAKDATGEFLKIVQASASAGGADFATSFVHGLLAAAADQDALAKQLLESAVQRKPDFAPALVALGRIAADKYDWQAARDRARQAIAIAPNLAEAQFLLAQAYDGLDENDASGEAFRKAVTAAPDEPVYALAFAKHARRLDDFTKAQRYFQQAFDASPTTDEALDGLIDAYLVDKKVELAAEQVKIAEARGASDAALRRARLILRFRSERRTEGVIGELSNYVAQYPDDIPIAMRLAAMYYISGDVEKSEATAKRVLSLKPDEDQAAYLVAQLDFRKMQYSAAIERMQGLCKRYPNRLAYLSALCDAYFADFRIEEARDLLRHLLSLPLEETERKLTESRLIESFTEFSEYDAALAELDRLSAGNDGALVNERVTVLSLAGRHADAVELARKTLKAAIDEGRGDQRIRIAVAVCLQACGQAKDFKTAEAVLREVLTRSPKDFEYATDLVSVLVNDKRPDDAAEALKGITPRMQTDAVQLFILQARINAAAKRIEIAESDLLDLLDEAYIRQNSAIRDRIRTVLVELLMAAQRGERALELADRWLAGVTTGDVLERVEVQSLRVQILGQLDHGDAYLAALEDLAVLAADRSVGILNDLGYSYLERRMKLAEATKMIETAVASAPVNSAFLDSLGWARYLAGRFDEAQKYLARAARLRDGQDATVHDHLGDAEYRLGDKTSAKKRWKTAEQFIEKAANPRPEYGRVLANIRKKLEALEKGEEAPVAPIGAADAKEPQP